MNYLLYIEHSAENLQFFLWLRDYTQRFKDAKTSDVALAPEWSQAQHDAALQAVQVQAIAQKNNIQSESAAEIFKDTDFEKVPKANVADSMDPFATPPRTPAGALTSENALTRPWDSSNGLSEQDSTYKHVPSNAEFYHQQAGEAFAVAGLKQPCTYKATFFLLLKG
jgi:hypothetical protein